MSEQHNEEITAAETARAELDARATELHRTGWIEPPDQPCLFVSSALDQDEWRRREEAKREAIRRRHLESKARAQAVLARGQQRDTRDRVVFKVRENAARPEPGIPESSESEVQMTETKTTEKLHPLEALAEELGIFAARVERETIQKVKVLKAEVEVSIERRLAEQAKEIAELRGMLSVLLTRAAHTRIEPDQPIDFNEARAATRN